MSEIDFESDAPKVESNSEKVISEKIRELRTLNAEVKAAEENLRIAKEKARNLSDYSLPELMMELGISTVTVEDGETSIKATCKQSIHAKIPEGRNREALDWLNENGYGGSIKNNVSVKLDMGEDKKAEALENFLIEQGYAVERNTSIHHQTLGSICRARVSEGLDLPDDLLGVYRGNTVKLKID